MEKYKSGRGLKKGMTNNPKGGPKGARGSWKEDENKRTKGLTIKFTEAEKIEIDKNLKLIAKKLGLKGKPNTLLKVLKDYVESL